MKKTNVLRLLDKAKIEYTTFEYEYDPKHGSALAVAKENSIFQSQLYKTLVGEGTQTGILVAVIPSNSTLNFKALCKASSNKKMSLLPVKNLQTLTGYLRGGCSPIGMKKPYPVFIDQSIEKLEKIYVNAGKRGLLVGLSPSDLVAFTNASVFEIIDD